MQLDRVDSAILTQLSKGGYQTAADIGASLQLSEKTIRNHMKRLAKICEQAGAHLVSRRGSGFLLTIDNHERFESTMDEAVRDLIFAPSERSEQILHHLLMKRLIDEPCTLYGLMDLFAVSESTMGKCLADVRQRLAEYDLELVSNRGRGMTIEGAELDIRGLLADVLDTSPYFPKDARASFEPWRDRIAEVTLRLLEERNITIPDISLGKLVNHIFLSMVRSKRGHTLPDRPHENDAPLTDETHIQVVRDICTELSRTFETTFNKGEISYIAICMAGQRVEYPSIRDNPNRIISSEIIGLIRDVLEFVYETMNIDLRNNFSLIVNLATHIAALGVRLRYNLAIDNPVLAETKRTCPTGWAVALQAGVIISHTYQKTLSNSEIGYLAMIFELAVAESRSRATERRRKSAIVVSSLGKASAELLERQCRESFGAYLDTIAVADIHDLEEADYSKIDYVFAAGRITTNIPVPIISTTLLFSARELAEMRALFERPQLDMFQFYKPDLFFPRIPCASKEQALTFLCERLIDMGKAEEGLLASVIERESIGSTDFGPLIALPHPTERITEQTVVTVGTTATPLPWGDHDISIIVLVSIGRNEHADTEPFYQRLSAFMLDEELQSNLIDNPTFESLLDILSSIS